MKTLLKYKVVLIAFIALIAIPGLTYADKTVVEDGLTLTLSPDDGETFPVIHDHLNRQVQVRLTAKMDYIVARNRILDKNIKLSDENTSIFHFVSMSINGQVINLPGTPSSDIFTIREFAATGKDLERELSHDILLLKGASYTVQINVRTIIFHNDHGIKAIIGRATISSTFKVVLPPPPTPTPTPTPSSNEPPAVTIESPLQGAHYSTAPVDLSGSITSSCTAPRIRRVMDHDLEKSRAKLHLKVTRQSAYQSKFKEGKLYPPRKGKNRVLVVVEDSCGNITRQNRQYFFDGKVTGRSAKRGKKRNKKKKRKNRGKKGRK